MNVDLFTAIIRNPPTIGPDSLIIDAIAQMSGTPILEPIEPDLATGESNAEARSSCVVVVDNRHVVGILTERDIVRLSAQQQPLNRLPVSHGMTRSVITLQESEVTDLFAIIYLLKHHNIRHLPIVDDQDHVVGVITHESLRKLTRPADLLRLRQVQEVMTPDVLCLSPDSAMLEVARQMTEHQVSSVVITVAGGSADAPFHRAVGLLTERDLVQFQSLGLSLTETSARSMMSSPVFTVSPQTSLWAVQQMMEQHWIRRVIVAGAQGELLGIVTQTSLLQAFNPVELYTLAEVLEKKVTRLEAERIALLEIRAAELERQVQERTHMIQVQAERDRLLSQLSAQILASQDVQVILDTTVEQVRKILGCDRVNIWQVEAEWVTVVVAESTDSDRSLIGERIHDTCFQQTQAEIYRQGHIRVVPDIYTTEMSDCHRDMLIQLQTRAKILVPLLCGDQLWGLLNVTEMQPREWQPTDVEFLRSLSTQLAIALQQAIRHHQLQAEIYERQANALALQQQRDFNQLIAEITSRFVDIHPACLDTEIDRTLSLIGEITQVDTSFLFAYAPDHDISTMTHEWCRPGHIAQRTQAQTVPCATLFPWSSPLLLQRQPIHIPNIADLPAAAATDQAHWQAIGIHSLLMVPLVQQQQVIGAIGFTSYTQTMHWEEETIRLLQVMGQTIASAQQRLRNEQRIQQNEERLRLTLATTKQGIYDINLITHTESVSPEYALMLGYDPNHFEETYDSWVERIHPEDRERVLAARNRYLTGIQPTYREEFRLRHRSGDYIWVLSLGNIVEWDAAGRPQRLLGIHSDISDRKQAEIALAQLNADLETRVAERTAELEAREARYRALMEGASDAILLANPEGYLIEANPKATDLLGYEHHELMGMHITQIHPPEALSSATKAFESLSQDGRIDVLNLEILRQDGQRIPVDITGSVIKVGGETIIQGIFHDIRDRQQAEQALRESETRFRRVFESNVVGMMFTDFSGQITDANDRFLDIIGYSRADLDAHRINWAEITPPEYVESDQQAIAELQRYGEILPWEKEYLRPDGRRVAVLIGVALLSKPDGRCVCAVVDISDRKRYETALQDSQQLLETVLDTVPLSVFWKNRQSVILGCNQAFATASGFPSPADVIGKGNFDLGFTQAEAEGYTADDREVINSGMPKLNIEETVTPAGGEQRWVETSKLPLRDGTGEIIGIVGTFQDITDRKRAEQIMRQQAERETLLREITQRIRESLDLQTIFNTACAEIRTCLQADRVGIFKFYPDSGHDDGEFVAESVVNGFPSVVAIRVHDHCFGENYANLYAQGRYYVVDDIYHNGLTMCHTDILAQFQVRANMVMPLLCNHELWGLLCIHQCDGPRHWQPPEIDLGQQLANQLAIAIQQAILYEQLQEELQERQRAEAQVIQQLRQQRALELILQQIRQSLDLPELLAIATQQVQELLQGDRVIVFQVCHDGHSHILEESVAPDLPSLKSMQWQDETWSQDILEHYWQGQPRIVPDVMNDIWTDCLADYSQTGQIQSKIVAPILQELHAPEAHRWVSSEGRNKLWGVLMVHACRARRVWQPEEAQLLQQIANQLAIAIQQSHLFKQLQQELGERQQAEHQLTQRNEELIRATRLKDEFLANMSHELRTPLNAILGMSEGLQEGVFGPLNDQQIQSLQTIERSGTHLLALINDVLDVAKIEAGQVELNCTPTAIAYLCQSSMAFIKQQAFKKRVQLSVTIPQNLPDIVLDERRIRQVLINLLSNAVKFTPEGGHITLTVTLPPLDEPNDGVQYLRFSVTDTGIGISEDNTKRLFQPFVQVDSALNRQYQGTGLGLALTKRIVDLHGGQVGLTSQLGEGSCFTIDLPYQASMAIPTHATLPSSDPSIMAPEGTQSPLILLVEDNDVNIGTTSSYLRAKGYRIEVAKNGQDGITQATALSPDLILMDIQMPGMDGIEAMQRIRQIPSLATTPIIALTALAMDGDRDRCLKAGANEYLRKPIRLRQLVSAIQALLLSRPSQP
jgi:PAS domain S-box-containing protein